MSLNIYKKLRFWLVLFVLVALAGCGGGGGSAGTSTSGTSGSTSTTAPTTSILPTLVPGDGINGLTVSANTTISAVLKDGAGKPISNAVVVFSQDSSDYLSFPNSNTSLTDERGVASVIVTPKTLSSGAGSITFSSAVASNVIKGEMTFKLKKTDVSIGMPEFGIGNAPLQALGATSVKVTVYSGTSSTPITSSQKVLFSSTCSSNGKAQLSTSVDTVNGIAIASYNDRGCSGTDEITARVDGAPTITSTATLTILSPQAASIQFVKADPEVITLKGTGGVGLKESSLVSFKVVNASGQPVQGKKVTFTLTNTAGGVVFNNLRTTTDAITDDKGEAGVLVQSGSVSTPVRVLASLVTENATLTTQSDQLTITTGIPDQDSFSLSADVYNIEGRNYDNVEATITARLGDHYNNPVPDGTTVNFTAEGGLIEGSCKTLKSTCSVKLKSQDKRPPFGRVSVLATALGEESFNDRNGNGLADAIAEMVDSSGRSTDLGEAFRDDNENGVRDPDEYFVDINGNGIYDGPDGKFNGSSCDVTSEFCSGQRSVHVRAQIEIIFSGSVASINVAPAVIDFGASGSCNGVKDVIITAVDQVGNTLPAGTTVELKTTNGKLSIDKFVVQNTNAIAAEPFLTKIQADGVTSVVAATASTPSTTTCTDSTPTGVLTVTVTTPKKDVTTKTAVVNN